MENSRRNFAISDQLADLFRVVVGQADVANQSDLNQFLHRSPSVDLLYAVVEDQGTVGLVFGKVLFAVLNINYFLVNALIEMTKRKVKRKRSATMRSFQISNGKKNRQTHKKLAEGKRDRLTNG
jgi:hypothetical protein